MSLPNKGIKSVLFKVEDSIVRGQLYGLPEVPDGLVPAVMYLHGYGKYSSGKSFDACARSLMANGIAAFAFDFRGCGESSGSHAEQRICDMYADAMAAYGFMVAQRGVDPDRIGVYGSSAGAYLAAALTYDKKVKALVMDAPAIYRDDWWRRVIDSIPQQELTDFRLSGDLAATRSMQALGAFMGHAFVVAHGEDRQVPLRVAEAYRDSVNNSQYALLEDVGHVHTPDSRKYVHGLALDFFLQTL